MSEWETFWKLLITAENQRCYSTGKTILGEDYLTNVYSHMIYFPFISTVSSSSKNWLSEGGNQ